MARLLILFAHPLLEKSRVHARLIREASNLPGVTLHDLYEAYPDFDINISREQKLLLQHDIIAWQHPFYWYSAPALIKQWLDLVLEHGWAYGSGGNQLQGKRALNIISAGGPLSAYSSMGRNRFTIPQLLAPFDQTTVLCKMKYLPPFVVPGTFRLEQEGVEKYAVQYRKALELLTASTPEQEFSATTLLNELVEPMHTPQS